MGTAAAHFGDGNVTPLHKAQPAPRGERPPVAMIFAIDTGNAEAALNIMRATASRNTSGTFYRLVDDWDNFCTDLGYGDLVPHIRRLAQQIKESDFKTDAAASDAESSLR